MEFQAANKFDVHTDYVGIIVFLTYGFRERPKASLEKRGYLDRQACSPVASTPPTWAVTMPLLVVETSLALAVVS